MLQLDDVGFAYGETPVLDRVRLAVGRGELVCIVGPNGAGKSTLIRLMAGLLAPDAGTVSLFGADPATAPRAQLARRMAYVPQEYRLTFPFSLRDVVLMGRYPHRRRGLLDVESAADLDIAREAMVRCDVADLADRRFDELSGGERRRALLAQAFCQEAELVLLDEPTASLDPAHAIAVLESVRAEIERREAAAVVVTHDLNLASRFADRLVVVHDRGIAADGPPQDVLAAPAAAAAFDVELHVGTLPGTATPFVVPR